MTVVARTTRDVLLVHGPEAVTWLQGQLSQDVAGLAVGDAAWTFVLAPQGKVAGWGRVVRVADDAVQVDVDPGAGPAWVARLERFKLRTKAALDLRSDVPAVSVRGRRPHGWLPAPGAGVEGGDLLDAGPDAVAAAVADGAEEVGPEHLEALRIRAGVPRWGAELDDDTIPATVGQWAIDASVSFTKGCYTGQELVARIDSRGGNVPRHLRGLVLGGDGAEVPPAGAEIVVGGDVVGAVTSAAPGAAGEVVALGYVKRVVEPPTAATVRWDGGESGGEVRALPLLPLPA